MKKNWLKTEFYIPVCFFLQVVENVRVRVGLMLSKSLKTNPYLTPFLAKTKRVGLQIEPTNPRLADSTNL